MLDDLIASGPEENDITVDMPTGEQVAMVVPAGEGLSGTGAAKAVIGRETLEQHKERIAREFPDREDLKVTE